MIIGVPKEIKPDERRVALTPAGVVAFRHHGHAMIVERSAGLGSGFAAIRNIGRQVCASRIRWLPVWKRAATMVSPR